MVQRALVGVVVLLALVAGCKRHAGAEKAPLPAPLTCRALQGCTDRCADAACAEACTHRLTTVARPVYEALQACVGPACADGDAGPAPCREPASLGCKMCVLSHCAAQATRCMGN